MRTYEIEISGAGSRDQLKSRLLDVVRLLEGATDKEIQEYKGGDDILVTDLKEDWNSICAHEVYPLLDKAPTVEPDNEYIRLERHDPVKGFDHPDYRIVRAALNDEGDNAYYLLDLKDKIVLSYSITGMGPIKQYRALTLVANITKA